jgi:hypothetical protein
LIHSEKVRVDEFKEFQISKLRWLIDNNLIKVDRGY